MRTSELRIPAGDDMGHVPSSKESPILEKVLHTLLLMSRKYLKGKDF
jgi:hypothetical protein